MWFTLEIDFSERAIYWNKYIWLETKKGAK